MKSIHIPIAVLFFTAILFPLDAHAIAAGAVETQFGKTICGLSWNYTKRTKAIRSAFSEVRERGGLSPRLVFTTYKKGYAAVACGLTANGRLVAAYVVGYPNASGARMAATTKLRYMGAVRNFTSVAGKNVRNHSPKKRKSTGRRQVMPLERVQ